MNKNIMCNMGGSEKMGDITMDLLLVGGLGALAYFIYTQFQSSSSKAQAANNTTAAANTTAANAASLQQAQSTGVQATLSASAINNLANSLAKLIQTGPDNTDSQGNPTAPSAASANAQQLVIQVNNAVDWAALVSAFGTRQDSKNNTVDLVTGLREIMTASDISTADSFFFAQGIGWVL
jgi:hypothetical protein